MFDLFGKHQEEVFESGLSDAHSEDDFYQELGLLEKKWNQLHTAGKTVYDWLVKHKAWEFIRSVISPVPQRAGLGCPPKRFTTNRSEHTNSVIQEFIKCECGQGKVDKYVFATAIQKLISMQEKEVEFAVVDKGEYKLHTSFDHIRVTASTWSKMTDNQMQAALCTISVEDGSLGNVSPINEALNEASCPVLSSRHLFLFIFLVGEREPKFFTID
jgi:hypothetical protein